MMNNETKKNEMKLPEGKFCGKNCADDCIYWSPYDRDEKGRQYCSWYDKYFFPSERQGCFSHKS